MQFHNRDAKELARRCGIPTIPGYSGSDQSTARFLEEINKIGYPVLLKASMGGGGRVNFHSPTHPCRACESYPTRPISRNPSPAVATRPRSTSATVTSSLKSRKSWFSLSRYLPRTRHIEIQVFGDAQGDVVQLGERECSLQRRYQKLIEESPCVASLALAEK